MTYVYRHYKGGLYRLLFTGLESTNGRPREKVAVYVSLEYGHVNVRRLEEFREVVRWPDGVERPRFVMADEAPGATP
jgi:hypothetical protein